MLINIKRCIARHTELFDSETARLDTELLLAHVLKKDRTFLFTWPDKRLSDEQYQQFLALLERRKAGEPIAYIVGYREFWSLPLLTNASTLIPRPDTEILVEQVLDWVDNKQLTRPSLLDLGTGTGAIALALAKEIPGGRIDGVDVTPDAVELAKENAARLSINNVAFYESTWFRRVSGVFDVVVSNPPYIDKDDPHLEQGDVRF